MALSTYDELKASVADFLNRSDLTSVIPDFIKMAETDMNRKVRHWRMENRASATISSQYNALPTDFLEPIRAHIETGDYRPIELISQFEMQQRRRDNLDTSGKPSFYSITQGEIEIYPTPDGSYGIELNYYAKIPSLSASQTTNAILTNFPDVYLYGSLVHSAPYLQEDNRTTTWAALYQSSIDGINRESDQAKFGGTGRRMRVRAY
tara:strand:+ start:19 stop:639 length:621 start_codon:yes stop_codon:yes gene_type:complete